MKIVLDPHSATAPYEQLKDQISEQIRSGVLPVHAKLPAIRALATELGLAANTVARSYKELEQEGYVITRGRSGTTVNATAIAADRALSQEASRFVAVARALGVSDEQISAAVSHVLQTP